jgi:DUF1680 family protein/enterochelin esterase-like enzyme
MKIIFVIKMMTFMLLIAPFVLTAQDKMVSEKYQSLPFGSIKPSGWLKQQMQKDMAGFVGNLDQLVPDLINDPIYSTERLHKQSKAKDLGNLKSGDAGGDDQYKWWNSETQSNWWDGYIRNALLLDDKQGIEKAQKYIDLILATQDEDGYLGIYDKELRYNFHSENGELWSKTTLYRGLLAWYEYTQDPKVWDAIVKAVDNVMQNYPINKSDPFNVGKEFSGGVAHGLTFTDILDRMYQLTKDKKYQDYALFLYLNFSKNFSSEKDVQLANILDSNYKLQSHGAHTYEHLRPLIVAAYASGKEEIKKALQVYVSRIQKCTTPTGGAIGDEWIGARTADATQTGYEYCSLHELLDSYSVLFQKSGNAEYTGEIERIFYNAAQGSRNPDHSCIAYLKTDNSYEMLGTKNGEIEPGRNQTRYKYSPAHQDVAVCCVPNAGRITPYFVKSMWMKDSDGILAVLAGPCEVQTSIKGVNVQIFENTSYPFENKIEYKVTVKKPVSFSLKIRIPAWAGTFKLNCTYTIEDGNITIRKTWHNNETIKLELSTKPEIKQDLHKEYYFTYGALAFALPIESREIITKTFPAGDFKDFGYEPVNQVKYRFSCVKIPEIKVRRVEGAENIWKSIEMKTTLVNEKTQKSEEITLLPLGATILRQQTFKNQVQTAYGTVKRFENFPSVNVGARNIDVWMPDGYDVKKKYAVLYMHDGQMLFDSTINWNHQEWGIDETLGKLIKEKKTKDCIVVGIWNTSKRHVEYFPQKALEYLSDSEKTDLLNTTVGENKIPLMKGGPISDNYLKFIVSELKPFIDSTFSTLKDQPNTFIAGSSMGGLISMYAICEYPDIFGGAACLSTHWPGIFSTENNPVPAALLVYMQDHLPLAVNHKIYFDYGSETLDAWYKPFQIKADEIMKEKGYSSENWITREFPGENHSEKAWNKRFNIPVVFLLGKQ